MKSIHSPVSVRPLTEDDLKQVLTIEKTSYPEPWTMDHFENEMRKPFARAMVLTDDETDSVVLGYIVYWIQAEAASLLNVTVHPEWRGMGFAQKLMRALINEAVREELPKIMLEVRASNDGAIRLYERLGFKKTAERKKFYSNGEAAIIMEVKTSDIHPVLQ